MVTKRKEDKITKIDVNSTNIDITDFIDTKYKSYVFYVLENRALPKLTDGLKTTSRKILNAAFKGSLKNGEQKKLLNLAGDTMNLSLYAHGDSSLNSGIATLCQPFNYLFHPLYSDGQVGSLRDPKAAASPRYLTVKQSKYADLWKTDYDLLKFEEDEGQTVEPETYYPIIPVVLCNMQTGMAPGYKFWIMSYSPIDIIDACTECLKTHKKDSKIDNFVIHPYVRDIKQKNWKIEEGNWVNYGEWNTNVAKDCVEITDLPYDMDYLAFEKLLNKLIEKQTIKDWENHSRGNDVHYMIKFAKKQLALLGKGQALETRVMNMFKLRKVKPDDLIWVLDENDKIRHFNSPNAVIEYFVNWRLSYYDERKGRLVKVLEERLSKNDELIKFIELVCSGKLKIRNRSKKDIKIDMDKAKLPIELISTPISKLTIEERDELLKQNKELREHIAYVKKTTTTQMYINDLKDLKKLIEKDF